MNKKQGNVKNQICVLRVNIHCDGCKKKVKKLLQKIEGVDATMIDAELGKVTVSGYVHPNILIKKLVKSGKHAELWTAPKNNPYAARNGPGNQFHDLQFENIGKPQKGGNGKGFNHDLNTKMGHKAPKSVRFDIPEYQFQGSDSEFSGSEDDDDGDSLELDFGRRPPSRTPTRGGGGYGQQGKKDNRNGPGKKGKSSGGKSEKGGIFGLRLPFFGGFGRKMKGKNSSARKKGEGGGGAKAGCMRLGAIEFKNGKGMAATKNGSNNKLKGGGGGNNQTNGGKNSRGGGQYDNFQEIDIANHRKGGRGYGGAGGVVFAGGMGATGNYPVGHMGNNAMGPIGNYPIGPMSNNSFGSMGHYPAVSQMGNYQAAPGMPAPAPINGGYYPGVGPMAMNQQHYTGMMMGQPHQQFNGMLHPTAYGRPPPTADYALHRASDGYSNMFNDESTESCSIM